TPLTPPTGSAGQPVSLRIELEPIRRGAPQPGRIVAHLSSGETVELQKKPDGTFSGDWSPAKDGAQTIRFEAVGGQNIAPIEIAMNVSPRVGPPSGASR